MRRSITLPVLVILILALSLALLPHLGLPYSPLEITALQAQGYTPELPVQAYLPLVFS
ncbi:MAG: hypothetical protein ACOYEW_00955 [Anaerolineae bacterium]|jgi:hypothetical protein